MVPYGPLYPSPRALTKLSPFQFLWHVRVLTLAIYALELQMSKWLWTCFFQVLPGIFHLWGNRDLWQLLMCPIHIFFFSVSTKFLDSLVIPTLSTTYGDTHLIVNYFFFFFFIGFAVLKVNYLWALAPSLSDWWLCHSWQSWEIPSSWHLMLEAYDTPFEQEWSSLRVRWARSWLPSLARGLMASSFLFCCAILRGHDWQSAGNCASLGLVFTRKNKRSVQLR